jgi:ATP-dependent helicase/nuclease subunit B
MKLEEDKEASLTAVNVGTFLHRVLEVYFSRVREDEFPLEEEKIRSLTDAVVTDVVREICPDDSPGGRANYLFSRLKRCVHPILRALDTEFSQSKFRPARFELPIGTGGEDAIPALPVPAGNGHEIVLRGTVDRLDAWRDGEDTYVRVVDYKTGAKKFSETDISVGINIQLLLYLFSVLRCPPGEFRRSLTGDPKGTLKPAAALYFSTRPGASRSDQMLSSEEASLQVQQDIERSGILVDNERVLQAMEADLAGEFIPLKRKKDGSSNAYSEIQLAELEKNMMETVARIGTEMCSGSAGARPLTLHGKDPCKFCKMYPLCRIGTKANNSSETEKEDSNG